MGLVALDFDPPWLSAVVGAVVGAAFGWAFSLENSRQTPEGITRVLYVIALGAVVALALFIRAG
jgi:4-amino-4-deoxy-L-arabinose transferase-like glycosyltransferase